MTISQKPLLLLLGDSLIDYGEWHRRMENFRVVSSGVPGERTEGLYRRLGGPLLTTEPEPAAIVVMSGTNDILFGDLSFVELLGRNAGGFHGTESRGTLHGRSAAGDTRGRWGNHP